MPVSFGKDKKGCYARWGSQKKYYYECGSKSAKAAAAKKAGAQGAAIKRSGYKDHTLHLTPRTLSELLKSGELQPSDLHPGDAEKVQAYEEGLQNTKR